MCKGLLPSSGETHIPRPHQTFRTGFHFVLGKTLKKTENPLYGREKSYLRRIGGKNKNMTSKYVLQTLPHSKKAITFAQKKGCPAECRTPREATLSSRRGKPLEQ